MLQLAMQLKLFNVYYIIGGVWTSVVTISSKSNDRLQGAEVHFFNPTLCVFFVEENSDIAAWKLGDKNIYEMMHFEGCELWAGLKAHNSINNCFYCSDQTTQEHSQVH